jgi:hypothetical protein
MGLTGVVIGQIIHGRGANKHKSSKSMITWSIVVGVASILSVLTWFLFNYVYARFMPSMIILYLANCCFVAQLLLFTFGAFKYWGE